MNDMLQRFSLYFISELCNSKYNNNNKKRSVKQPNCTEANVLIQAWHTHIAIEIDLLQFRFFLSLSVKQCNAGIVHFYSLMYFGGGISPLRYVHTINWMKLQNQSKNDNIL